MRTRDAAQRRLHQVEAPDLLGGRELGFGSDLDVLFVYREAGEVDFEGPERATRVAQRTMRLLSQPDGEGPGYSTDARLRPSGSHG